MGIGEPVGVCVRNYHIGRGEAIAAGGRLTNGMGMSAFRYCDSGRLHRFSVPESHPMDLVEMDVVGFGLDLFWDDL